MSVVCCLLFAVCCCFYMVYDGCCFLFVAGNLVVAFLSVDCLWLCAAPCCLVLAACCLVFVVCCAWFGVCYFLFVCFDLSCGFC